MEPVWASGACGWAMTSLGGARTVSSMGLQRTGGAGGVTWGGGGVGNETKGAKLTGVPGVCAQRGTGGWAGT